MKKYIIFNKDGERIGHYIGNLSKEYESKAEEIYKELPEELKEEPEELFSLSFEGALIHNAAESTAVKRRIEREEVERTRYSLYPSHSEQFAALHEARQGNTSKLEAIDEKMARINTENPLPK